MYIYNILSSFYRKYNDNKIISVIIGINQDKFLFIKMHRNNKLKIFFIFITKLKIKNTTSSKSTTISHIK